MNDYKELIECCREHGNHAWYRLNEAADAIEQLVKEIDAAVADISWLIVNGNACTICEHNFADDSAEHCLDCHEVTPYGNYKWRGVQE